MSTYRVPVLEDFAWQPPVADRVINATVHSDVLKGDRYLVIATASDMFTGQENNIATATKNNTVAASDWMFDTPVEGHTTWVKDEDAWYVFDGTNWNKESINAAQSQILLLESEMSQVESKTLVLESEMSQVESRALLLESEAASNDSAILLLESRTSVLEISQAGACSEILVLDSEMSAVQADKQDLGTYVSEYGAIQFTV